MVTYIIFRQRYSETAGRIYGHAYVWDPVAKTRLKPPQDERSFHSWLWVLVKKWGEGVYRIVRTAGHGERRGFHGVGFFYVDQDHVHVEKKYSEYKSHVGLPPSRQLYYKRPEQRTRFRKRGVKRF